MIDLELEREFDQYEIDKKIQFKAGLVEFIGEMKKTRRSELKSGLKPEFQVGDDGKRRLIFRDESGEILRNRENKNLPMTAADLYGKKISDLVDPGRKQGGAGTGGAGGGGNSATTLDLTGIKSQVKADETIKEYLMVTEGLAKTDPKFGSRHQELRKELGVGSLPIREES